MLKLNRKVVLVTISFVVLFVFMFNYNSSDDETMYADFVAGWDFNTSRDTYSYIQPEINTALVPVDFCNGKIDLLIIVCSSPRNSGLRSAIRETWGATRVANYTIKTFFLLGQASNQTIKENVMKEYSERSDVIVDDFLDTYNNLTVKSLRMLKLIEKHCLFNITFLMKADDDLFVNFEQLNRLLNSTKPKNVLMGHLIHNAAPIRNSSNKWYTPYYLYKENVYPNYLSGTSYVMSTDVVRKLYKSSMGELLFYLEDVYITGIVAEAAGVVRKHNSLFTYWDQSTNSCEYLNIITAHALSEDKLRSVYKLIHDDKFKNDCKTKLLPVKNESTGLIMNLYLMIFCLFIVIYYKN